MKRRNLILLALALMLTGMLACAGALADEVMYVRTNNGGHLKPRDKKTTSFEKAYHNKHHEGHLLLLTLSRKCPRSG